jgi:hypothetical protein
MNFINVMIGAFLKIAPKMPQPPKIQDLSLKIKKILIR